MRKWRSRSATFEVATAYLDRALKIVEAQFPPDHVDVMRTLSTIATMHRIAGRHALARGQFEEVLARFERSVGTKHPFANEALFGMGETLKVAGELERAEGFYLAALDNFKRLGSQRRLAVAECLEGYADLLARRGRADEAQATRTRAVEVRTYLAAERAASLQKS